MSASEHQPPGWGSSRVWAETNFVAHYATRALRPAEIVLLLRYGDRLDGRVLELGCGAGRITSYLGVRGGDVLGIDISPAMIDYCRGHYPGLEFQVGDVADLSGLVDGSRDLVIAEFNILGVLDDDERRRALREIRRVLGAEGTFLFSAHNLAFIPNIPKPLGLVRRSRDPARLVWNLARLPFRLRNHRRLAPLERREEAYALINDQAHDFRLLHYYIGHDGQRRQLEEAGFELVECLDGNGRTVDPGDDARAHSELHYAARVAAVSPT